MSKHPTIVYAPRHTAISAMLGIVATPPIPKFVTGEIRGLRSGGRFQLKAKTEQARYPTPTEWIATGKAQIAKITPSLRSGLMAIWGDTEWVFGGDQIIWIEAHPVSTSDREALIDAYCVEIETKHEVAREQLVERWLALRQRLG